MWRTIEEKMRFCLSLTVTSPAALCAGRGKDTWCCKNQEMTELSTVSECDMDIEV